MNERHMAVRTKEKKKKENSDLFTRGLTRLRRGRLPGPPSHLGNLHVLLGFPAGRVSQPETLGATDAGLSLVDLERNDDGTHSSSWRANAGLTCEERVRRPRCPSHDPPLTPPSFSPANPPTTS
nr:hypothetical protein CFP56_07770 [Quercus suber]